MKKDDKFAMSLQEEEELIASSEEVEGEEYTENISEEKAEAIAIRLADISSIIKKYVDSHPDSYQEFVAGKRGEATLNPTPTYQETFRERKR